MTSKSQFFDEFSEYMESLSISSGKVIILGDFNFHMEDNANTDAIHVMNLIQSYGFIQHVEEPTHEKGHMLDLVMSRLDDKVVRSTHVSSPISDHCAIHCRLDLRKANLPRKTLTYRQLKKMDVNSFKDDLSQLPLLTNPPDTLDELLAEYDTQITGLLDKHAPLKTKTQTLRPHTPWFNEDIYNLKKQRRKAELQWRKSHLEEERQIYCNFRDSFNAHVIKAKTAHFNNKVEDCGSDQKALFRVVNQLLGKNSELKLPSHDTVEDILDKFGNFFSSKIQKIRQDLDREPQESTGLILPSGAYSADALSTLKPVSTDSIIKLVKNAPTKSLAWTLYHYGS
jgi:hypothetical protein